MTTITTTGDAGEAKPVGPAAPPDVPGVPIPAAEGAWVMAYLACLTGSAFVVLVFCLLLVMFFATPKQDSNGLIQLLTAMAGILGSTYTMLMGFFFGNARKQAGG